MRWKFAAAAVAFAVTTACVPKPIGPSHNLVVSYRALLWSPFTPGPSTLVQGTVTNTGVAPADYTVELVMSSGETQPAAVADVLVGETAIWSAGFTGDVTISQVRVTSSAKIASSVPAVAAITSQRTRARRRCSRSGHRSERNSDQHRYGRWRILDRTPIRLRPSRFWVSSRRPTRPDRGMERIRLRNGHLPHPPCVTTDG